MTAAATQQPPVIPPRPSRGADKEGVTDSTPKVPPRPVNKRLERSTSPNSDRFAPSPLNGGIAARPSKTGRSGPQLSYKHNSGDPIERSNSVPMPSVGEEGVEYDIQNSQQKKNISPEQTRTIANDLELHAPKPSLPAQSAKQRVMAVTRTDSERAASFGIGKSGHEDDRAVSRDGIKKKPSTSFSMSSDNGHHDEEDHGIPEIGRRVPMNPHLGDVQAPSPGPDSDSSSKKHHVRKLSSRGLPPGSYGLHGHGVTAQDKLEKAYYQKHPDALEREQHTPLHDRTTDFSMSSNDLNKLVRDTANRRSIGSFSEIRATPTDECAFQASQEYACRMSSPGPASATSANIGDDQRTHPDLVRVQISTPDGEGTIHVDDPRHPEYISYGDEESSAAEEDDEYRAPILASDEVGKDAKGRLQHAAVQPHHHERRSSMLDTEKAASRPTSRPGSMQRAHSYDFGTPKPLEDVEEYEPLFSDETKHEKTQRELADENKGRRHFPSKDIWEDAPSSVYYTTEVSTPDVPETQRRKSSNHHDNRPMTPAQAFALHQEELAEKESREFRSRENNFLPLSEDKPTWVGRQGHLRAQKSGGGSGHRFPSRDVWEDVPESMLYQTTLSGSPAKEQQRRDSPAKPAKKSTDLPERPAVPDRPKPRQSSGDDVKQPPPISDKPKPQIPARPTKSTSGDSQDGQFSKPKPPVPSRPSGSKISALQAGFMTDLNKRLQLGPQGQKKEEAPQEEAVEEKEKAPLSDARKSRARGPQRRAPAKSPAPEASAESAKPTLSFCFSLPQTSWTIDPENGRIAVDEAEKEASVPETVVGEPQAKLVPKSEAAVEPPITDDAQETEADEHAEKPNPEEAQQEEPKVELKTLAANMAGESVLESVVEKTDQGNEVEPVEVHDDVKA